MHMFDRFKFVIVSGVLFASIHVSFAQLAVDTTPSSVSLGTSQFLWYDTLYAIRLGKQINSSSIGTGSFASGYNATAPSLYAFSFGSNSQALGQYSFAFGSGAVAQSGRYAIAFGSLANAQESSVALGYSPQATGHGSFAAGFHAIASGQQSTALGAYATATASDSVQIGNGGLSGGIASVNFGEGSALGDYSFGGPYSSATGNGSLALGYETWANGLYSSAIGSGAFAIGWGEVALGLGTVGKQRDGGDISSDYANASELDPVLEVALPKAGSGIIPGERGTQNALTIYRNGEAHFVGPVRVPPSGDIPMIEGASGVDPTRHFNQ